LPSTIAIRRELHEETSTVLADPTQLHQVLINLCTNAAHAMRDAGGILSVRLDAFEATVPAAVLPALMPGAYRRLMVRDTGHGMSPEDAMPRGTNACCSSMTRKPWPSLATSSSHASATTWVTWTSSVEALKAFHDHPDRFDLVITDQTMPHMTGDVLAQALCHMRSDLPIILCTGFSQRIMAEQAETLGIDAVCLKPLVARDLARTIHQVFAQRTAWEVCFNPRPPAGRALQ
jgi:CheY-like chemotaxis protein